MIVGNTKSCRCLQAGQEKSDRKSTRLNSSHLGISYAVFCLKKKQTQAWDLVAAGAIQILIAHVDGELRASRTPPASDLPHSPTTCPFPAGITCFFFNDTATTEIYTLSLHDALPI